MKTLKALSITAIAANPIVALSCSESEKQSVVFMTYSPKQIPHNNTSPINETLDKFINKMFAEIYGEYKDYIPTFKHFDPEWEGTEIGFDSIFNDGSEELVIAYSKESLELLANTQIDGDSINKKYIIYNSGLMSPTSENVLSRNVAYLNYDNRKSAFLTGIMACHYVNITHYKDTTPNPKIAIFADDNSPLYMEYMSGYLQGIEYFNNKIAQDNKGLNKVLVSELNDSANNGDNRYTNWSYETFLGARVQMLLQDDVDLIIPLLGSRNYEVAKLIDKNKDEITNNGVKMIGMEYDQSMDISDKEGFKDVYLTSINNNYYYGMMQLYETISGNSNFWAEEKELLNVIFSNLFEKITNFYIGNDIDGANPVELSASPELKETKIVTGEEAHGSQNNLARESDLQDTNTTNITDDSTYSFNPTDWETIGDVLSIVESQAYVDVAKEITSFDPSSYIQSSDDTISEWFKWIEAINADVENATLGEMINKDDD